MLKLLIIGAGGFIGAIARYGISGFVQVRWGGAFPLGTLVVNVAGCFLLGVIMSTVKDHPVLSPNAQTFLTIGILGAFTTFSTFGYETSMLLDDRRLWAAGGNVLLNVVVGLLAVELGWAAARLLRL
jgi:CrcB protein